MARKNAVRLLVIAAGVLAVFYFFMVERPLVDHIRLGLDLQGGTRLVLQAEDTPDAPVTAASLEAAVAVIRERVDRLGLTEPAIYPVIGEDRIVVELAGVSKEEARDVVRIANISFVEEDGTVVITGRDLVAADAVIHRDTGQPIIILELTPEAQPRFADATTRAFEAEPRGRIFIYLDDEMIQAPYVSDPGIRTPQITGYATYRDAWRVATILNAGRLPLALRVVEEREVTATLGRDSINRSVTAGLVGIMAVVAYMAAYYRAAGLVASFALSVYLFLVLATLAGLGAVLTLPGVAGLILSLGMAVDANVISFEKLKEELRLGRTLRSAVDAGFARAWRTILDANVTTLIAAAVLYRFGTGPVRGFAVTLSIGIAASVLTAVVVTRYLLRLVAGANLVRTAAGFVGLKGGSGSGLHR